MFLDYDKWSHYNENTKRSYHLKTIIFMGKIFLKKKWTKVSLFHFSLAPKSWRWFTSMCSPFTCFGYVLESIRFHVIFWYWFIKVHVKRVKRQIKHANFVNGKGSFSARITCVVNETTRLTTPMFYLTSTISITTLFLGFLITSVLTFALKKICIFIEIRLKRFFLSKRIKFMTHIY